MILNYYKKYSDRYKIAEKNGKGKEYNKEDKLIFEGEYLNGKRWNVKGYNKNGIIEFELKNEKWKWKRKGLFL